jgi:hypothetical protein
MGDLRQAIENYVGDAVGEPWDSLLEELTVAISQGSLGAAEAARVDLLLALTKGRPVPDECPTCKCPYSGLTH